jgi:hypothetical protein
MMKKNKERNRRERERKRLVGSRSTTGYVLISMKSSTDRRTYTHTVGGFQVCRSVNFKCGLTVSVVLRLFVCLFVKWGKKVVRYQMKGDEDSRCFYVSIFIIQTIKRIFSLQFIWMDLMKIPRRLVYFFLPRAIPLLFVFYPWLN